MDWIKNFTNLIEHPVELYSFLIMKGTFTEDLLIIIFGLS